MPPGTRIGGYEVSGLLGRGGMGEVYRAHDPRLNRDVAIKVLLPAVANDADRLARFAREAKVLASLDHPNIAHIHGLESSDLPGSMPALVMELVEGPTLADRLGNGALPLDEALSIAVQIADAVETAHDRGIIHRDLKPANIKVRDDGTVKVLDFGLAKSVDPAAATSGMTHSPTITSPAMTEAGIVLGTAAYMSPEQAKGRAVDKRSDVWAFGAVLYEMLSGARAFDGEDTTDVLGAVVRLEPDWSRLPAETPPPVRALVQGCLAKDRRQRIGDMAAALFVLRSVAVAAATPSPSALARTPARGRGAGLATVSALAGAVVAVGLSALLVDRDAPVRRDGAPAAAVRFTIAPPDAVDLVGRPAISPDGRHVVMEGTDRAIWIRTLSQAGMRRLAGTEGGTQPFWAPDSRSIAFFAGGKLKKMDHAGGSVLTVCDVGPTPAGGSWGAAGVILFAPSATDAPIFKVAAAGGVPVAITTIAAGEGLRGHAVPHFLTDGRRFLYRVITFKATDTTTRIGSVDGDVDAALGAPGDSNPVVAGPDTLLFARGTTLLQQAFDASRLATVGEPTPVLEGVDFGAGNTTTLDASMTGALAYVSAVSQDRRQLAWVTREGAAQPLGLTPGGYDDPVLSPDGRQVALTAADSTGRHIWVYDLDRGTLGKRTFEGDHQLPLWSPDGRRLVFSSGFTRGPLLAIPADGSAGPEPFITNEQHPGLKVAQSWSPDGRRLVFQSEQDLYVREPDGAVHPVVASQASEREGRWSPDGRWLAYSSSETGRREVYVQSYPAGRGRWQVSTAGGAQPMWAPRGGELFYTSGNRLMTVTVDTRDTFKAGTPRALFELPIAERNPGDAARFAVAPDAQRFLVLTEAGGGSRGTPRTEVILNWRALAAGAADGR